MENPYEISSDEPSPDEEEDEPEPEPERSMRKYTPPRQGKKAGIRPAAEPVAQSPASQSSSRPNVVLASAVATSDCTFHGVAGAELRVKLVVHKLGDVPCRTYLAYYAYVSLRRPGRKDWESIGSILSYRLSRPTALAPLIDRGLFVTEWLEGSLMDEHKYSADAECIASAMRALYDDRGNVRDVINERFHGNLSNDGEGIDLVYISQVYIKLFNKDDTVRVSG